MTNGRGGWADRIAILLAVVFVAILALLEFTVFRPQHKRLVAAEAELKNVQDLLAGVARRNLTDQELFLYAGTGADGSQFSKLYAGEGGLVYLTRLIEASGLSRLEFKAEASQMDKTFRVEKFFVALKGSYPRILGFMKSLEGGARLARIEQIRIEKESESSELVARLRIGIYSASGRPE